jgi:hypothetical protein
MANLDQDILHYRQQLHLRYMKQLEENEKNQRDEMQAKRRDELMQILRDKYGHYFSGNPRDKFYKSLAKFIYRNWFEPVCLNEDVIVSIPGIYRLRVYITNYHLNEYTEANIDSDILDYYRHAQKTNRGDTEKVVYFRWCFDIRDLYPKRNEILEIDGEFYFLQPEDHVRLCNAWNNINGQTTKSIRYLSMLEYSKSVCSDFYAKKNTNTESNTDIDDMTNDFIDKLNKEYLDSIN